MKKLLTLIFCSTLLQYTPMTHAQESTTESKSVYIPVGKAKVRKSALALTEAQGALSPSAQKALDLSKADLEFLDQFNLLKPAAFSDFSKGVTPGSFDLAQWKKIAAEYVFKSTATSHPQGLSLESYLYEVSSGKVLLSKKYLASLSDTRTLGHTLANDIVKAITGQAGLFQTKISMVCDRTGKKELYVMDFDGSNVRQITKNNSVVTSPSWSTDGTKIVYSLIAKNRSNIKNMNLYEFDFKSSTVRVLSDRQGVNSGARYHPLQSTKIALTMSFLGNPEIFILDTPSKSVTRITQSAGVDVDPSWSPDGSQLVFVSSRQGPSMVYKMKSDGSNVQRLTFAGKYNASPAWSPSGSKIVFAGWIDHSFDLFTMNAEGSGLQRLTQNQGSNEDPGFSPDSNFIVFSSNRAGNKNIYVMNSDGSYVKRLTYGLGNCITPQWSN